MEGNVNGAATTLASALSAGVTSMSVASSAPFGTPPFRVTVFDSAVSGRAEVMLVTAVAGTTWTVTRSYEAYAGSQVSGGVAFHSGSTVRQTITVGGMEELVEEVVAATPPSGAAGGDLTGSYPNPTLTAAATPGIYNLVAVDAKGRVTSGSTVAYLTANQTIALSGDAVGSGATAIAVTLKAVGTAGAYGDATHWPVVTTDVQGRVSAVTLQAAPTALPPSGAAGGDLAGSYPNPTLAGVLAAGGPVGSSSVVPVITWDAKGRLTTVSTASISVPTGANPTATIASAAVNGSAATFMRSDAAPKMGDLTGPITSTGLATAIASQTGTGSKFVMDSSPTLISPALGTPTSGTLTNCTGYVLGNIAGGTAGSVPYVGGGGSLAQDNSNLFWDGTNHRLGVGNAAPFCTLHVGGNVSGGTNNPAILVSRNVDVTSLSAHCYANDSIITAGVSGNGVGDYDDRGFLGTGTNITINHWNGFQWVPTVNAGAAGGVSVSMTGYGTFPVMVTGTVPTMYHHGVTDAVMNGGSIGTQYGYFCPNLAAGTTNKAFYAAGTTQSTFGGFVMFGTASAASEHVHVQDTDAAVRIQGVGTSSALLKYWTNGVSRFDVGVPSASSSWTVVDASANTCLSVAQGGVITVAGSSAVLAITGLSTTSSTLRYVTNSATRWNIGVPAASSTYTFVDASAVTCLSMAQGGAVTFVGTITAAAADFSAAVTAPTAAPGTNTTQVATTAFVTAAVATAITGTLKFMGSTDCSGNPNYPAASKGDVYVVSVAGKIGGASGTAVDVGDQYFAIADNAGGTQAAVGTSWDILEHNLQGALLSANNLSDVASASSSRTNLGLGGLSVLSAAPAGTLTGTTLNATVVASSLTSTGTLTGGATGAGFTVALSASTVTGTLPAANMPALTGDATTVAGAVATTLATVNSNVGSYTNASITVNAKGLVTAASSGSGGGMAIGGTVTSGTSGSILYVDSSVFLAQQNTNLFWDATNHRLGVQAGASLGTAGVQFGTGGSQGSSDVSFLTLRNMNSGSGNASGFADNNTFNRTGTNSYTSFQAICSLTSASGFSTIAAYDANVTVASSCTSLYPFWSEPTISGGTTTTLHHFHVVDVVLSGAGACTTQVGYFCPALANGSAHWAVYADSSTPSRFGAAIFGSTNTTTVPSAPVHVRDSTAVLEIEGTSTTAANLVYVTNGATRWTNGVASASSAYTMVSGTATTLSMTAAGLTTLTVTDAATSSISAALTIAHTSSGTPAAGFGTSELWTLKSSTTAGQSAAEVDVEWDVATHASRRSFLTLSTWDVATQRKTLRLGSDGTRGFAGVLAGTSTQYAKVGGKVFDHFTDAGNTTSTETDLYSDTLPANIFSVNGDTVEFEYAVNAVSNIQTKRARVYFAGTLLFDTGALSTASTTTIIIYGWVIQDSSTTVRYAVVADITGVNSISALSSMGKLTGLTLTGTNILKVTGQSAGVSPATNDIVAQSGCVYFNAAA